MQKAIPIVLLFLMACGPELKDLPISDQFKQHEIIGKSGSKLLQEASGLAASFANPGYLWTHNDSGGEPALYLIDEQGDLALTVNLEGATNYDWEDLTITRDGSGILYVGDIGDNRAIRKRLAIYRISEPTLDSASEVTVNATRMTIQYAEGARDAETLMVDPFNGNLIILTKREAQIMFYDFPFEEGAVTVTSKGTIDVTKVTAGDINQRGDVLFKSYDQVFYLKNEDKMPITQLLLRGEMNLIEYEVEKQGEALTWGVDGQSFFLLSEWNENLPQPLYRYY